MHCAACHLDIPDDRAEDHARYVHPSPRACACGCGTLFQEKPGASREQRFATATCAQRNSRARLKALLALERLKVVLGWTDAIDVAWHNEPRTEDA